MKGTLHVSIRVHARDLMPAIQALGEAGVAAQLDESQPGFSDPDWVALTARLHYGVPSPSPEQQVDAVTRVRGCLDEAGIEHTQGPYGVGVQVRGSSEDRQVRLVDPVTGTPILNVSAMDRQDFFEQLNFLISRGVAMPAFRVEWPEGWEPPAQDNG